MRKISSVVRLSLVANSLALPNINEKWLGTSLMEKTYCPRQITFEWTTKLCQSPHFLTGRQDWPNGLTDVKSLANRYTACFLSHIVFEGNWSFLCSAWHATIKGWLNTSSFDKKETLFDWRNFSFRDLREEKQGIPAIVSEEALFYRFLINPKAKAQGAPELYS